MDLAEQQGVYLLQGLRGDTVYVGQAKLMGRRLAQHTWDRLAGRWIYFSWFGIRAVGADGKLAGPGGVADPAVLVNTLESVLIEAIEPRQNRQRGSCVGSGVHPSRRPEAVVDDGDRIRKLERQLAALQVRETDEDGARTQVVERQLAASDTDRIAALESQLEELIGEARSVVRAGDQRPAIQVIQRTEVDGGRKLTATEKLEQKHGPEKLAQAEKAGQVMAWGCAVAMVLWAAWCFSLSAARARNQLNRNVLRSRKPRPDPYVIDRVVG